MVGEGKKDTKFPFRETEAIRTFKCSSIYGANLKMAAAPGSNLVTK
jgi:hypothetical protein